MEMSQGTSLCSYLKQAKMSFSSTKSENRKMGQVLSGDFGTSGSREKVGKGPGMVNIVQILCTQVCKWKNGTC
jgi:hypothetical protein